MKWVLAVALQLLTAAAIALGPGGAAAAQTQPHISLQPDMIPAGGQTTVSGAGFCGDAPCSSVTILLDGAVAVSGVPVGTDGTFVIGIMPISTPGRRIVSAEQDTPGGRISAEAALTLTLVDLTTSPPSPGPTGTSTPSSTYTTTPTATPSPSPSVTGTKPGALSQSPSATDDALRADESGGGLAWWGWALIAAGLLGALAGAAWLALRARRLNTR